MIKSFYWILLLGFIVNASAMAQQTGKDENPNGNEASKVVFGKADKLSLYGTTNILSLGGYFENNFTLGLGLELVVGHRWNRFLHTGLGLGLNNYDLYDNLVVVPVFVEAHGYLLDYKTSPHYSLSFGYGFVNTAEELGISNGKGGFMLHPALGVTLGQGRRAQYQLEMGYRFQRVRYTKEYIWSTDLDEIDIYYRRFMVRLGVQFNFYLK